MVEVTYDDYKNLYGGTIIPLSKFPQYKTKAVNYLNELTQDQMAAAGYEAKKKLAICAVADAEFRIEGKEESTSESNGSVSQSFDQTAIKKAKYSAAKSFLGSTGLLYRGV